MHRSSKKACVFLAAVFAALCFFSIAPATAGKVIDPSGIGAGYSSVLYNNSNGLPTSEANDIVQSENGFIWICGYSGLIRYDGNDFYRYDSSSGIASVVSLFIDSRQRLWIGTNDSGIAVFENERFTFYNKANGLRSSSVRDITEDTDGNIIVATTTGMAYIDKDGVMSVIDDPLINNEYVCQIVPADDGTIYGVTLTGRIFTLESKKITGYYNIAEIGLGVAKSILPDPANPGFVYVGSRDSEVYYGKLDGSGGKFISMTATGLTSINCVTLYDDCVWVCSDSGIGFFTQDGSFVRLLNLPMTNSIDHMMVDYEGNIWFTSSRQGVMKIVENRFSSVSEPVGLGSIVANSTCLCKGDLYIATDKGLYIIDKNQKIKENDLTERLKNIRIRCIALDKSGYMWLCTYGENGLVKYDPETDSFITFTEKDGMVSNAVRMCKALDDGSIAAATIAGVSIIKDDRVVSSYGSNIGMINLEILCVEEGVDGTLYFGSDGGGIYVISGEKVSRIGIENGLKSEVVMRIKKDTQTNGLWAITSNSISYIEDGTVKNINSFPYSNNFDLFFDENNRAWILSSNGIYVVSRADLISDNVREYTLFDKDYGLPGIATANSYSAIDENGDLYVSSSTGVYKVNINRDTGGGSDIKLNIPFVSADDEIIWIKENEPLRIPSGVKRLNIYANAYTYSLNNPHLSYMLEGFDDTPVYLTKQKMTYASYTNLRGGTYKFTISIIDDITGKIEKSAALTIIKESAIYENAWFALVAMVVIVGLISLGLYLNFKRKTAAIIRKENENKELIAEMSRVFSGCIDMKDAYTKGHSARVAKYTAMMAEKLGKPKAEVENIYNIALLHDIGKISIPDNILNKPGKLDNDEYAVMKSHADRGYDILKEIKMSPDIALGAGYHHEKYDGTGYPMGLKGDEIPEIARIIAVADAFDAMYSTRPYRQKMPIDAVKKELLRCSGTQFSPEIVDVMVKLIDEGAFDDDTVK